MPRDIATSSTEPRGNGQSETTYANFTASTAAHSLIEEKMSNHAPLTPLERFAVGKSDSVFNGVAGATAGTVSGIVTCPLDVIKTKLQAQGGFRSRGDVPPMNNPYVGMRGTFRVIWREDGLRGMYRGLGPIILGYLPTWATWFVIYGRSKVYFKQYIDNDNAVNFVSSVVAGGCSTFLTNPIWVIKTRMMSQVSRRSTANVIRPPWHYNSTIDAARQMYRTEGFRSFYSGLTPALLGLTHVAVQFPAYEFLKRKFTGGVGLGERSEPGQEKTHFVAISFASFFSKLLASSATYPHEVIRTRLQTQQRNVPVASSEYNIARAGHESPLAHSAISMPKVNGPRYKGIITTFRTILKEEGWRAFYAGMGTNMMRAIPAAMTTVITYEYVVGNLHMAKRSGEAKMKEETW